MTALLADPIPTMPAMPRLRTPGTQVRPVVGSAPWVVVAPVRDSSDAVRPVPVAEHRYEWTDRGLAVILALVALVVAVMVATLVSAFLAVSNEPIPPRGSAATVAILATR